MNFIATPFIQYRNPVGLGPSSKTCPRWNTQLSTNTQNTTASADQLKFVFKLVFWFFWGTVLLHFSLYGFSFKI